MLNRVKTERLKEHHKNGYYFTDIEGEKYREVRRSIEQYGIRDPIKITTDYIVISGHQRLRIARDIGMDKVPVEMIPDLNEQEVEYLLIAENVERRGQAETDPIKKSRILNFMREYWKSRDEYLEGRRKKVDDNRKTFDDVAEIVGESKRNARSIMKLNDLIPEIQLLISEGKLGTTAGEQLAHLTKENQRTLLSVLGEEIKKTTVAKAKEYRGTEKESSSTEDYEEKIQLLQKQVELERKERERLEQLDPEVIEVDKTDYTLLSRLRKERNDIEKKLLETEYKLDNLQDEFGDLNELRNELNRLSVAKDDLLNGIEIAKTIGQYASIVDELRAKHSEIMRSEILNELRVNEQLIDSLDKEYRFILEVYEDYRRQLGKADVIDMEIV